MGDVVYPHRKFWLAGPIDHRIDYVTLRSAPGDNIRATCISCGCSAFYKELPTGYVVMDTLFKCQKELCRWKPEHGLEVAQLAADSEMATPGIVEQSKEATKVEVKERDQQYTTVRIFPL